MGNEHTREKRNALMSDFTDAADRQLVQLAAEFATRGQQIHWGNLAARMKRCAHSKEALQRRLKTLKRTHGSDVRAFPPWYFRETSARRNGGERDRGSVLLTREGAEAGRVSMAIVPPPKRLLPPLEYVCGSLRPVRRRRLFEEDECGGWRPLAWESGGGDEVDEVTRVPVLPPMRLPAAAHRSSRCGATSDSSTSWMRSAAGSPLELLASVAADEADHCPLPAFTHHDT